MASDRKADYIFYERKVRDEKELESLLLQGDDSSDEDDEWVVQKSAKKLTTTPRQKNGILGSSRSNRHSSSLKSPRKALDSGTVSPIKIKRKLSYPVNKVETPPNKRPDIVSPILIKRLPDTGMVTVVHSPSACYAKPTIELTSSDDDEEAKKSKPKRKNKKRPKSTSEPDESDGENRRTKTLPKKRITYFEESEDDVFELNEAKSRRKLPPRKSRPAKLKLSGSEEEELSIKKTPSRRCKLQQNLNEESSTDELTLPLSAKKKFQNDTQENDGELNIDELALPVSSKERFQGNDQGVLTVNGTATPSRSLTNGTPLKALNSGTPSKLSTNGTPVPIGKSPSRISSRNRSDNSFSSFDAKVVLSDGAILRVLNALESVERLELSPSLNTNRTPSKTLTSVTPKKSTGQSPSRVSSRKSSTDSVVGESRVSPADRSKVGSVKSKGAPSCTTTPSKLVNSPAKSSVRTSRKNLKDVFVDGPYDIQSDTDSESSSTEESSSSSVSRKDKRNSQSQVKTPSNFDSSGEVNLVSKGTPAKTPAKSGTLRSADAVSEADATPEKGATPGKAVAKSMRTTPAKGSTPSKSTTPAKPSSVVIPVSSSEDEEELATPLRRGSKRAAKSKPSLPPKVETPLRRSARTPMKTATPVRRSARVSMSPSTPSLRQKVLLANTPRSSLPPVKDESESEDEFVTPRKTPKSAKKKLDLTPSTPASCRKVGRGFLSPVVQEREKCGSTPTSDLGIARAQLQVSTLPKSLPCREKEFNDIKNFIVRKLQDGTGGCMYISGVPGTGKTATVHTVVRSLQKMAEDRELAAFDFVEVNGLRLTEPRQAYVRIWQGLTKNKVTPDQSLKNLETKFNGKPKRSTVLLVDELDYLCNRRQDVIYNILDWTTKRYSKLVVLTIANTMDLPERTLKGKVTSRMGLTRLGFQSYNFHQLEEIVLNRLDGCKAFNPDAVQLVARKVAAVSGDARRALDICRRSTEILELEGRTNVSVLDIQKVLTQIFAGTRVQAVKNCSLMAKLVLRAIRDEVLRTGVEETTIAFIHPQLVSICALEGTREPTITDLLAICSNLAESGLIFAEKGRKDINRKISLNVGTDDIHYAMNCSR